MYFVRGLVCGWTVQKMRSETTEFVRKTKIIEVETLQHIIRAHFQGTAQRLIYIRLPAEDRQKYGEDKFGRLIMSMFGTHDASHIWHSCTATTVFVRR